MKSAIEYLEEAKQTMEERGKVYDNSNSERSMSSTIKAFNQITGNSLKESDGWLLMLILKQVRQNSTPNFHEDSCLDSVAYSSLLAEALYKEDINGCGIGGGGSK